MKTNLIIDAEGKVLGRIAGAVAKELMGKNRTDYAPNKVPQTSVTIINASKTNMTEKRMLETMHEKYSGYPGGLSKKSNKNIIGAKGFAELYRLAVYSMLPANKLRALMMKNLKITE